MAVSADVYVYLYIIYRIDVNMCVLLYSGNGTLPILVSIIPLFYEFFFFFFFQLSHMKNNEKYQFEKINECTI